MTIFPVLRDWITEFLDQNDGMVVTQRGHNMLIEQVAVQTSQKLLHESNQVSLHVCDLFCALCRIQQFCLQVLRLLHYLVKFGYYGNIRDIQELQKPLINLLNGKNDLPFVQEDEKGENRSLHKEEKPFCRESIL